MMKKSEKAKRIAAVLMSMCVFCAVPAVISGCGGDEPGQHQTDPEKVKDGVSLNLKTGESTTVKVSDYITANGNAVTVDAGSSGIVTATLAEGVVTVTAVTAGTGKVILKCKGVEITFNVTVTKNQLTAPVFQDKTLSLDLSEKTSVTLALSPDENDGFEVTGYEVASLISGASIADGTLTFTPADTGSYAIKIKANFIKDGAAGEVTFTVTVTVTRSQTVYYEITINGNKLPNKYAQGSLYKLPEFDGTVPSGQQFAGWKINGGEATAAGSEITVNADLIIEPYFTDIPQIDPVKVKDGEAQSLYLADNSLTFAVSSYITVNGHVANVTSQNTEVATVSLAGDTVTVTAHKAGKADITLKCEDITLTFPVTVRNAAPTFAGGSMEIDLYEGESKTGAYTITPSGADTFSYEYSVTDSNATVTNGVVSYTAPAGATVGTVNLTVSVTATDSATDARETASFTVAVNLIDTTRNRIKNGGFETGKLDDWTLSDPSLATEQGVTVVQDTKGYWSGTGAYNHVGKYHFNGQGGGIREDATYTLTSSTFVLGGSGYISFKIGGHAAVVKIYDKATNALLAEYTNTAYADVGIKDDKVHLEKGARQAVMSTYVADLREYLGLELYLVLEDNLKGGWGHSIMDDVITYYKDAPSVNGRYDTVENLCGDGGTTNIPWVAAQNKITANRLYISKKIPNAALDGGTVNLESYLSEAEGKLAGQPTAQITKSIVKVQEGETVYTQNFANFTIEKGKTYIVTYKLTSGEYSAEATFKVAVNSDYQIKNGDFETGDLTGWTYTVADGSTDFGRIVSEDFYWGNADNLFNKEGDYLFTGIETVAGPNQEAGKGTLTSSEFTLKQNGWISFLMGGAHNVNCGIRVKTLDGTVLAEFNNLDKGFDGKMDRYKYQFTGMDSDKQCVIEIFDNAEDGWGLVVVDDIRTDYGSTEPEGTLINKVS